MKSKNSYMLNDNAAHVSKKYVNPLISGANTPTHATARMKSSSPEIPVDTQDTKVIDEAVSFIKGHSDNALKSAIVIGWYLLNNFFDGDIKRYENRKTSKYKKRFHTLCRNEGLLKLGHSERSLRDYMQIAATDKDYPASINGSITLRMRQLLLRVPGKDKDTRIQLAEEAVLKGLSTRDLQKEILELRKKAGLSSGRKKKIVDPLSPVKETSDTFIYKSTWRNDFEKVLDAKPHEKQHEILNDVVDYCWNRLDLLSYLEIKPIEIMRKKAEVVPYVPHYGAKTYVQHAIIDIILGKNRNPLEVNGFATQFREPFCGSAVTAMNLLLYKMVSDVWLNDKDVNVVNLLNILKDNPDWIKALIEKYRNITKDDYRQFFLDHEAGKLSGAEETFAFIIERIFSCNHIGNPNINPYCWNEWNPDLLLKRTDLYHKLLTEDADVIITNIDALEVILAPGNCFIFLDPPYKNKGLTSYAHQFNNYDHKKLADTLKSTNQRWLMTYDNSRFIRRLYSDQTIKAVGYRSCGTKNKMNQELWICPKQHSRMFNETEGYPEMTIHDICAELNAEKAA